MRNDLPNDSASNFSNRVRETLMTYLGKQGDPLDRGLTLRDLVENGLASLSGGKVGSGVVTLKPGSAITQSPTDLTPPPTPTNFIATAGISTFLAQHDTPAYTQGGGHLRTHLYGKIRNAGDPVPVFADAEEIAQFTGAVYAHSTNPATTWHLWAKWETKAGVLSASPAGGTNGVVVTTGQDVSKLLDALTGKITTGQLYPSLVSRIDLIDGPSTLAGSVSKRIADEAAARTTAIDTAVGSLQDQIDAFVAASGGDVGALLAAINTEQASRISGDTALAYQNTLLLGISGANTAAIGTEASVRATATSSLSQSITTLLAASGNAQSAILNESQVRSQADAASSYQINALKSSVDGATAGLAVERETRATNDTAVASQLTALNASFGTARGAILTEQSVRAAADQVLTTTSTGLSAIVASTSAALTTESLARASADAATVQTTTSLLATVGASNASIGQEQAVRITAQSALASQITTLGSSMGANIAAIRLEQDARTAQDSATTSQITTLQASVGTNTAAIQTEATVRASETGNLFAKYTIKLDVAGHVSGYGLLSTGNTAAAESEFGVRADSFFVAPPATSSSSAPTTNLYVGYAWIDTSVVPNVTKYWNGTAWVDVPPRLPFVIQTSPTTINGVSVPAGVYMDTAFIRDGTITNAKIGNAAIDNAKIANLDAAKITTGFLSADRIQANSIDVTKIDTRGLTVKDSAGNVVLYSGSAFTTVNRIVNASMIGGYAPAGVYINTSGGTSGSVSHVFGANGAPLGFGAAKFTLSGPVTSGYSAGSVNYDTNRMPVTPGQRLELSAYCMVFRGVARLEVTFRNAAGTAVAYTPVSGGVTTMSESASLTQSLSDFTRLWGFATVPAGASLAVLEVRVDRTSTSGATDLYVALPYMGLASAYQEVPSAWSDGPARITPDNATTYIADASIGSAKFANTIESSNFVAGSAGWQINRAGSAFFNEVSLRGNLTSGDITGWAWPPANQNKKGVFLGPNGLLIGNANDNRFFSADVTGNIAMPGFNVTNGVATFSGVVAGNVTVTSGQVTGLLIKTLTAPATYSGIAYDIYQGTLRGNTTTPWTVNGSNNQFLVWSGTMPAPETAAHKIAYAFNVNSQNNRGTAAGDLDIRVYVLTSISGFTASGELIGIGVNSAPYSQSVTVTGSTAGTYATAVTVAVYATGYVASNTITWYGGLFWGAR